MNCVTEWVQTHSKKCRYFACLNPHSVEIATRDPFFHNALSCADFLTADGIGIVYASRILGGGIRDRITGTDVFLGVNEALNREGATSCFFLGSTEETLQKVRHKMADEFPNVTIAGTYSPPFKAEFSDKDNQRMIAAINSCSPDVLWVGMTAPKQEKWIHAHQSKLDVTFAAPVGAVFDFFVGNVKRAGPVWQKLGLEWLPRMVQEPRRLWRRVLVSGPGFLLRTIRYRRSRIRPHK
ncbi:MAG: WecB/TagA/CpsF family glycosyltransferase [Woeseiaceae bacterium]|nr:WecB/TagA/CpsF family glycosyltransferase [Woeseiaceae bacterium]